MSYPTPTVPCLYTTVKNPLSYTRTYGYVGAHGRDLTSGAEYSMIGDIVDVLTGDKRYKVRATHALQRDLLNVPPRIEIISTPPPIFKDTVTFAIKTLGLTSGALGVIDPCWGSYTD